MNHHRCCDQRKAFTILEVMLAASILVVVFFGMIQAITSGSEILDFSRKQTIAAQIIRGQIDSIRLSDYTTVFGYIAADANPTPADVDGTSLALTGTSFSGIAQRFTCKRKATLEQTNLIKVTFKVTWTNNTFAMRSYHLNGSTYVGKNGSYVTYQHS